MTTNEHDTDPSTPSARRSTEGRADSAVNDTDPLPPALSRPVKPATHRGIGPPSASRPAPGQPMGIVVPAVGPDIRKDSVELLLEGITGPQPARTKTTPQTDGEASASYHARHDLRPARMLPEDEPKVVVEKPAQLPTLRIERPPPAPEWLAAARDPTAAPPPSMAPRVAFAVVSGLVVVVGLFVVSRLTIGTPASEGAAGPRAAAAAASSAAAALPPPVGTAPPAPNPAPAVSSSSSSAPSATAVVAETPRPAASASGRPKARAAAALPTTHDIGELKTNFQ